jgi:hypothetical protein
MMEAILSSETSVLTRATRRHIPDDGILHSHRCEYLKSYIYVTKFVVTAEHEMSTGLPLVGILMLPGAAHVLRDHGVQGT